MKIITSRDNPVYKELKLLATSSQARRKAGRTLLDGVHLCQAYGQHLGAPALCIVSEAARDDVEVQALTRHCLANAVRCLCLPAALYNSICQVENGVGIMFVISTPTPSLPPQLDQSAVLLDNLQDPGNLGSILRSAAAAGIKNVFCSPGTAFAWSPKVMRAGMGAHFLLNIFENIDLAACLAQARIPVLATSSHTSTTIYDVDLRGGAVWLFGHEGQGVAAELMALASCTVTIPQQAAIESLNVAASAAVCFFEQVRQQRTVGFSQAI
ncbi:MULTISPECIES: RNA methyltransferase [unclassified Undibacterium]|uniref:TrmH family RNA methyltransferase n=1 Tax=unclassified Undibacterium TaxID=2630295 RepID=UPI002AC8DD9C|nr:MULTISPECIES: RNA methyltransferase [unclassified Undibacterium]MEB0138575.1 RNA methyltransferase [Undibacterium sp. CCC2.1]MEB0171361.1 RNA methyltransferase [Undibacterium sp. CCC1.1]MEB0175339.1 RNA methyltransferase [Undibacterium sp. CCC3.4]MEB0214557.1 RNA methyltransferase [Undibacterium sp. 5I2]WPX43068.1 RNA methyltransferase [Undibacterium sp. CCC3.4]